MSGDPSDTPPDPVTIHVCVTCKPADFQGEEADRPGAHLYRALQEAVAGGSYPNLRVEAAKCLSVCKRPCTVAVAGAGRWSYIYGDLDAESSARTILDGAARYAGTPDGIVPWRERPDVFRKGVVARIPPFPPPCPPPVPPPGPPPFTDAAE
jgi:predicted metal-binding protein